MKEFIGPLVAQNMMKITEKIIFRMEYSHSDQPSLIQIIMMLQRKDMLESAHGFCVVYSVTDRSSFHQAELYLQQLATEGTVDRRAVILVANKVDLARSRVVSEQGMSVQEPSPHSSLD